MMSRRYSPLAIAFHPGSLRDLKGEGEEEGGRSFRFRHRELPHAPRSLRAWRTCLEKLLARPGRSDGIRSRSLHSWKRSSQRRKRIKRVGGGARRGDREPTWIVRAVFPTPPSPSTTSLYNVILPDMAGSWKSDAVGAGE